MLTALVNKVSVTHNLTFFVLSETPSLLLRAKQQNVVAIVLYGVGVKLPMRSTSMFKGDDKYRLL